jgi:hypothetical protein
MTYRCIKIEEIEQRSQYSEQTTASMKRGQISVKANDLALLQKVQTGSGASCSMCTGVLSGGLSCRGVQLTTHLHIVPELRISGAMPLFLLYACMVRTETSSVHLPSHQTKRLTKSGNARIM